MLIPQRLTKESKHDPLCRPSPSAPHHDRVRTSQGAQGQGRARPRLPRPLLFALALDTGLREHEALALDVGDVTEDGSTVKRRISLRVFKRCTDRPAPQESFLPDSLHYKLGRLLAWKRRRGESLAPEASLFVSREGNRLSTRMAATAFRRWQQRAGLDRIHNFSHTSTHGLHQCLSQDA